MSILTKNLSQMNSGHFKNAELFERAQKIIPGGVNSPVRAFKAVGGTPVFFSKAQGAYLWDVEGKSYLDYVGSWGPMILGHSDPEVLEAMREQLQQGLSFGAPSPLEIQLAEKIQSLMPSMQKMRFVNSGTEATMSAIRLARGFTGRNKIIKFNGCYHGHADSLLVMAGSGGLTFGNPSSPGVPSSTTWHTLSLDFNNIEQLKQTFEERPEDIAAVIIEPIAGNMNMVMPTPEFLNTLRALCTQYGAVLIFDEVMTGFRVHLEGAQTLFNITPDLTCLGKIVGGGMPVGVFGGREEIMNHLAPLGPVYQAGTLSGNPLAMAAGIATLEILSRLGVFELVSERTEQLIKGLCALATQYQIPFQALAQGGMFGFYFTELGRLPQNLEDVQKSDLARFNQFFHHMLNQGIYLAPSGFEAGFVSYRHTASDIQKTLEAAELFFKSLKKG